jgi:hypothetical protein
VKEALTRVNLAVVALLAVLVLQVSPLCGEETAQSEADPVARESIYHALLNAPLKGKIARLHGGNDVKFIVRLDDGSKRGLKAIFRPEHLADEWKHRKEIAAYRLAQLNSIKNVPTTVLRALPQKLFRHAGEKTLARLAFRDGVLEGALQLFVQGAHDPLGEEGFVWAREHLAGMSTPAQPITMEMEEARQFARLLVFDYLQSNPDRFSGGNLLQTDDGTYWFIDNADTYYGCTRPRRRIRKLCHFDRTQIAALRELSEANIEEELRTLLGRKQVGRIWQRLQEILARVDTLIAEHGEDNVLF